MKIFFNETLILYTNGRNKVNHQKHSVISQPTFDFKFQAICYSIKGHKIPREKPGQDLSVDLYYINMKCLDN